MGDKSPPKRLTGATMNMRFMKRKGDSSTSGTPDMKEIPADDGVEKEWTESDLGGPHQVDDSMANLPLIANAADMFGISAEIVGRRSFGNFNKAVQDTYASALEEKVSGKRRIKAGKKTISDEEMIARYQKYVKGEDNNNVKAIGNLAQKGKRKKKLNRISDSKKHRL